MNIELGSIYVDDMGLLFIPIEKLNTYHYACISMYNGRVIYLSLRDNCHLASKVNLEELNPHNIHSTINGIFNI